MLWLRRRHNLMNNARVILTHSKRHSIQKLRIAVFHKNLGAPSLRCNNEANIGPKKITVNGLKLGQHAPVGALRPLTFHFFEFSFTCSWPNLGYRIRPLYTHLRGPSQIYLTPFLLYMKASGNVYISKS